MYVDFGQALFRMKWTSNTPFRNGNRWLSDIPVRREGVVMGRP